MFLHRHSCCLNKGLHHLSYWLLLLRCSFKLFTAIPPHCNTNLIKSFPCLTLLKPTRQCPTPYPSLPVLFSYLPQFINLVSKTTCGTLKMPGCFPPMCFAHGFPVCQKLFLLLVAWQTLYSTVTFTAEPAFTNAQRISITKYWLLILITKTSKKCYYTWSKLLSNYVTILYWYTYFLIFFSFQTTINVNIQEIINKCLWRN